MFKKKPKTKFVAVGHIKDWRDCAWQLEHLGNRLDKARDAAGRSKEGTWAHTFWSTTADQLFRQWTLMIKLKDTGLRQVAGEEKEVHRYDWWEKSEEIQMAAFGFTVIDDWIQNMGLSQRLDESWDRARDLKVQKARQGLA
jgi:hypothetical protein